MGLYSSQYLQYFTRIARFTANAIINIVNRKKAFKLTSFPLLIEQPPFEAPAPGPLYSISPAPPTSPSEAEVLPVKSYT